MLMLKNGRLLAQVNIQNKTVVANLDTGAGLSVINEHLARKLDNGQEVKTSNVRVRQANDTFINASQYLMVTIRLGTEQVHMPLIIMPSMREEVILGRDFMFSFKLTIQCGGLSLRLDGQDIPWSLAEIMVQEEPEKQLVESSLWKDPRGLDHDTPREPLDIKLLSAAIPEVSSMSPPFPECQSPTKPHCLSSIPDQEAIIDGAAEEPVVKKSTDWVMGPPEWRVRTPNNTLPATLRDRLVQKLLQPPKKDLKYLLEVEGTTFRVHINKSGKLTLHLYQPGGTTGGMGGS